MWSTCVLRKVETSSEVDKCRQSLSHPVPPIWSFYVTLDSSFGRANVVCSPNYFIFVLNAQEDGITQTSYVFMGFWRFGRIVKAWNGKYSIRTSYLFLEIECNPSLLFPQYCKCSISIIFSKELFKGLLTSEYLMHCQQIDIPGKYWSLHCLAHKFQWFAIE